MDSLLNTQEHLRDPCLKHLNVGVSEQTGEEGRREGQRWVPQTLCRELTVAPEDSGAGEESGYIVHILQP